MEEDLNDSCDEPGVPEVFEIESEKEEDSLDVHFMPDDE